MKFYIAARFTEKDKVRGLYQLLKKNGHQITTDWTLHKPIKPYDKNAEIARDYALEDMNGAIDCDVFVLITSEETGTGSSLELGAAISSQIKVGKPKVYVMGEYFGNNFFYFHPTVIRKNNIEEVLDDLKS